MAELVANCYDADADLVNVHLPDALDPNAIISITDNGSGMSPDDLRSKFLYIGRQRRQGGERTTGKRLVIGSKGIGKLAGFGISKRIRITTRQSGEQSIITIDRSILDSVEKLTEHEFDIVVSPSEADDGTTIELLQLHEGLQLPSADVVRRHLFRVLPVGSHFSIQVNNTECSAETVIGEKSEFSEEIPGEGKVSGYYIIANNRQSSPGLAVRVRGRIVQEPSLFGLDTRSHGFFTAEKIVGEIHADFLDPEVSVGERRDHIKLSRDGFVEDSEIVQKFDSWASDFVKKVVQGIDKTETERRTNSFMASPEIKARIDALPPHIRGTASIVVRGVVSKLKTASDDDTKNLIEWILRYYESNVLKELMNAIISADIHETEKLATLVSEWGVAQLNSVAGIISTQISIITRLEELIASDKSQEIDLHKLIESNLWLVREGLEVWSSDKPLKTLLNGVIDVEYAHREDIRPDIVCRSRDNGNDAVILEFKRPKERIVMKHVTQALEYEGIIKANRPSIRFITFVVGRQYDPAVLAIREKQAQAGLHLLSFEEILQKARARFEQILEVLGR